MIVGGIIAQFSSELNRWWPPSSSWGWFASTGSYMIDGKRSYSQAAALTFARAGDSYRFADDGKLWTAVAANTIRTETGGVLIELAATNMLIRTDDLTHAAWTKAGTVTTEAMAIGAPAYGNWTRINRGTVGVNSNVLTMNTPADMTPGEWYCGSIFFMAEGADIGKLVCLEAKRGVGATYAGNTIFLRLTGEPQRVDTYFQAAADNTKGAIAIKTANTDLFTSVLASCPQFELGKHATSPIKSTDAAATKAADVVTMILPANGDVKVKFGGRRPIRTQSRLIVNGIMRQLFQADNNPFAICRKYGGDSNVFDFEIRPTDNKCHEDDNAKRRAEIMSGVRYPLNTDIWNAYDLLIGDNFTASLLGSDWCLMGQWHGDASDGRSPYIGVNLIGNDLQFYYRTPQGGGASGPIEVWRISNVERNRYYRIIMQHKVHATAGYMKLWIDGILVVDQSTAPRPFGFFDHAQAGYWKEGIYQNAGLLQTSRCTIQNSVDGTADLSSRILNPPALELGEQTIAGAVAGNYVLSAAALRFPIVSRITVAA